MVQGGGQPSPVIYQCIGSNDVLMQSILCLCFLHHKSGVCRNTAQHIPLRDETGVKRHAAERTRACCCVTLFPSSLRCRSGCARRRASYERILRRPAVKRRVGRHPPCCGLDIPFVQGVRSLTCRSFSKHGWVGPWRRDVMGGGHEI